ncbi:MAG TPA: heme exporter protein CcmB [Arenimonas sp.]|nr:heme exporter protein CcmB [Arenimonas sp.]
MNSHQAALPLFVAQCRRDLRLMLRRRGDIAQPILFAIMVITLFTLATSAEPTKLAQLAPGIIWVAILLSSLLSLDSIYRSDFEDGSLEQMLMSPAPLALLIAARILVHWLSAVMPLVLLTPLFAQMLFLPGDLLTPLMISLLVGTPLISLVGAVIAALTVGIRHSGMLLALLALPLYVPILVFGAGAVVAASQGFAWLGAISLLGAGLVIAIVLAPVAAAAAIKISLT